MMVNRFWWLSFCIHGLIACAFLRQALWLQAPENILGSPNITIINAHLVSVASEPISQQPVSEEKAEKKIALKVVPVAKLKERIIPNKHPKRRSDARNNKVARAKNRDRLHKVLVPKLRQYS